MNRKMIQEKRRQTDTNWLNVHSKYTAIALFLFIKNPFNNTLRKINYVNRTYNNKSLTFPISLFGITR